MSRSAYTSIQIIILFVLATLFMPTTCHRSTSNCSNCMENGIACASKTQYFKCENGTILKSVLYDCPEDTVCTQNEELCMNKSTIEPACGLSNVSLCGLCAKSNHTMEITSDNTTSSFACVGPKQYKSCQDQEILNNMTFNCKQDTVCNIEAFKETGEICVPKKDNNTRDYLATCQETLTISPKDLKKACQKFGTHANIFCFNIQNPYDSECESYLHCNIKDGSYQVRVIKCKKGFYDIKQNKCVLERPTTCDNTLGVPMKATATSKAPLTASTINIDATQNAEIVDTAPEQQSALTTSAPEAQNDVPKENVNDNNIVDARRKLFFMKH